MKIRNKTGALITLLLIVCLAFSSTSVSAGEQRGSGNTDNIIHHGIDNTEEIDSFQKSIDASAIIIGALQERSSFSASSGNLKQVIEDTAAYLYRTVKAPQVGSIGGEWAVLGLARSGYEIPPKYYEDYYNTVVEYAKACKGILHEKKYTEYSRLIVALTSIGADPANVGGYNLLTPLGDFDKTIWQGINGPIWALIALDSGDYAMPKNSSAATQATRAMYVDEILSRQLSDGGFSLFGGSDAAASGDEVSDPDITGMALQALSKYQDRGDVKKVTEEALACLSKMQRSDGGFSSWGTSNSESCVQVLVALTELGIPLNDSRFVKNGNTVTDNLLTFYVKGKGFLHTADGGGSNQMATEQAFYGLVAADRAFSGKNTLYRMGDSAKMIYGKAGSAENGNGLTGKNENIKKKEVTLAGRTFSDISGHKNQQAIEALAAREIINGKSEENFKPDDTMTRAEFSTIITKALGLRPESNEKFSDVSSKDWFALYVGAAANYGIINGTPDGRFNPQATITKQEAAVMVTRAADLCGMDITADAMTTKDVLSQFPDYITAADWARLSLAFCYKNELLSQEEPAILPAISIKRCEIAEMLYRMLSAADLT